MFIPACMSNEKLTNFYILEQNSETPHGKKIVPSKSIGKVITQHAQVEMNKSVGIRPMTTMA